MTTPPAKRFSWNVNDKQVANTPHNTALLKAAHAAFLGYMTTYDDSMRAPRAKDWTVAMKKYAAGQAFSIWKQAWQSIRRYGGHWEGTTSAVAQVDAVGANQATIRACMDISDTEAVDAQDKAVPLQSGIPSQNFARVITVKGGKVTESLVKTQTGNYFSC